MPDAADSKIRVMQVAPLLEPGGLEAVIARLVESLDPQRFVASACAIERLGCFGEQLRERGFTVYALEKGPGIHPSIWLKLARILRGQRIDIVHAHNFQAMCWSLPAAKLARVRAFVYTVHGNLFRTAARIVRAERLLARFASRITAISHSSRRDMAAARVCDPAKVLVIPNGIDAARYQVEIDRPAERARLGLPPSGPVLGLCSRIVPTKGVHYLIDAMPEVIERLPDASALIVGEGPAIKDLQRQAAELALADRVVFTGYRDDVPGMLAMMDLFVLPSESEGLSIALLEAMAAGLPAVATNVGDNPIAIADGQTGRLIDLKDIDRLPGVLIEVLSDEERLGAMGRRARERVVERYSLRTMIERYEQMFTELARR